MVLEALPVRESSPACPPTAARRPTLLEARNKSTRRSARSPAWGADADVEPSCLPAEDRHSLATGVTIAVAGSVGDAATTALIASELPSTTTPRILLPGPLGLRAKEAELERCGAFSRVAAGAAASTCVSLAVVSTVIVTP